MISTKINPELTENTPVDSSTLEVPIEIAGLNENQLREELRRKSKDVFTKFADEISEVDKLAKYKDKIKREFKNVSK